MHSVVRLVALLLLGAALALASPTDTIGRFGLRARSGFLRGENAGRMARGLPPTKPRKLFNPSKTGASLPRRSSTPSTTFFVAAGPAPSNTPTRKRGSVPGFFTVSQGVLQYTTDQAAAAELFWLDDFHTELGWVATEDVPTLSLVSGTSYGLYAIPNGALYSLQFSPSPGPSGSAWSFLSSARYQGDLNPYLNNHQYLWVKDGSDNMLLAPSVGAASGYTVMVTETFVPGQPPSLSAASAVLVGQLANPVNLFARNALGTNYGYLTLTYSGSGLFLSGGNGATFYVPTLGNGQSAHELLALQSSNTMTIIGTPAGPGAESLGIAPASTTTSGIINFLIPDSKTGLVSLQAADTGAPLEFYVTSQSYPSIYACDSAADCAAAGRGTEKLCLEVVPVGTQPSVCAAWTEEQFATKFVERSALYVYDPTGAHTGYLALNNEGSTASITLTGSQDQGSAQPVYLNGSTAAQPVQQLFTDVSSFAWAFQAYPLNGPSTGVATLQAGTLNSVGDSGVFFNLPSDISTGGIITVHPSSFIYSGSTGPSWSIFIYTGFGSPWFIACESAAVCDAQFSTPGSYEVCVEVVPMGGTPSACAAAHN